MNTNENTYTQAELDAAIEAALIDDRWRSWYQGALTAQEDPEATYGGWDEQCEWRASNNPHLAKAFASDANKP